jgi:flagellar biosynthetic protein FliR
MISINQLQLFVLALSRILMALSRIPNLGGEMIPTQVRLGLGIVLALVIMPWQTPAVQPEALNMYSFAINVGRELLIGGLIGFAAGLAFDAVKIAGDVMGLESGFSSGQVFNPLLGAASPAFVQLFTLTSMLLFLVIDGQTMVVMALARTFEILPLQAPLPLESLDAMISQVCQLITAGIQLGLPLLSALFLADLALGLLARVAPHIQVYFLGLPFKVALSLFGLGLVFTTLIPLIETLFHNIGPRILSLLM